MIESRRCLVCDVELPITTFTNDSSVCMTCLREFHSKAASKTLAEREWCSRNFLFFANYFSRNYLIGLPHAIIANKLQKFAADVVAKRSPRLAIFMPPRHGKSHLASICFPAWYLGNNPYNEVIISSYNVDLPTKFSRAVRNIFRDPRFQYAFSTALSKDTQSSETWMTRQGGAFVAAGVGGGIVGKGADILIIDDPIKNAEESDSKLIRDKLWDWYMSTAYTRLMPGAGLLLIQTCWHDDDLAGRLQQEMKDKEKDQFDIVTLKAIADDDEYITSTFDIVINPDPSSIASSIASSGPLTIKEPPCKGSVKLVRKKGEALHEARYSLAMLNRIKATYKAAPRFWHALYQQNPIPEGGMFFTRASLHKVNEIPEAQTPYRIFIAWDFAITKKKASDYTVGIVAAQTPDDSIYFLDMIRGKFNSLEIVSHMIALAKKHLPFALGVENGQIWQALEPLFKRESAKARVYPPMRLLKPITDKEARARIIQGRLEAKKVYLLNSMPVIEELIEELLRFPSGKHDDIVDAMAWIGFLVTTSVPPKKKLAEKKQTLDVYARTHNQDQTSFMSA